MPVTPFVLSSSGTVLSFAPVSNLNPATQYTIQVAGLADTFGGAVVVPVSSFTTKAAAALNFDPNAITFSFPDANGNIQVTAPAGSLPSGTQVLIIDQTSALVLSLTARNDGSVSGSFLGTINDTLQITVTDPNGATASFTRSQFVAPDGTTAVGVGGGTVTGPGGVELRIPNNALTTAATFQIQSFGPDLFPERPDFPGANFGSGLQITSSNRPTFNQEVKLAFPKPADAPDGAFYYVYRRILGPNNQTAFETMDEAFVEGQGASAKVVTASYPFAGDIDSIGTYVLSPTGEIGVDSAITTLNVLMWTIDAFSPLLSTAGVVTGIVNRPKFGTTPNAPVQFEGIPGVAVTFADASGNPDPSRGIAVTQADGRYTLFNPHYRDGTATVVATVDGETKNATAFEFLPTDVSVFSWLSGLFARYKQVASANMTFSALVPPPPAPLVGIHTFTGNANNRTELFGVLLANSTITIGFRSSNFPLTLSSNVQATIQQGSNTPVSLGLSVDSTDTTANKMDLISSFALTQAGSYTVTVTVPAVLGGQPIVATHTFLVIANSASGNNQNIPGTNPDVITALLVPQDGATDVPTDIFPQVVFTQPVVNVKDNIQLFGSGHFVNVKMSAVGVDAQGNSFPITDLTALSSNTAVTSITLQPVGALQFNTSYSLKIAGGILSTDPTAPLPLAGRSYTFTTFSPQSLGTTGSFSQVGMFVSGTRVYVAARGSTTTSAKLIAYDITNPGSPRELADGFVSGLPLHMAGEKSSPLSAGSTLLAVAATEFANQGPSNLWFYQDATPAGRPIGVSTNGLQRIGAVSLTGSTQEGTILRVALKDNFAYTITYPHGIQMVDMGQVMQEWSDAMNGANGRSSGQMFSALATPGGGWATDAVVSTVPIPSPQTGIGFAQTNGLAVGDFVLADGSSQTLVVATGLIPLLIVNPQASTTLFNTPTPLPSVLGSLVNGWAVALGTIPSPAGAGNDRKVALIVGTGTAPSDPFYQVQSPSLSSGSVLAIMDVTVPQAPTPLGFFLLDSPGQDVQVNGTKAFVSTADETVVIDFTNPAKPESDGVLPGSIGKLALADPNLVLSSSLSGAGLQIVQLQPLRCSTLSGPGISPPADFSDNWVGWTLDGTLNLQHGLTVKNVVLGQRHMADDMSLPYFTLQTEGHPNARCQLTLAGPVCDNTDPATRIRLVSFQNARNATNLTVSASYVIDRLFGDPEAPGSVKAPQACLLVTQNYEFDKTVPNDPCEPTASLPCTRFKPTVEYQYFHDVAAPNLTQIQMAQRFHFNAIEAPPLSNTQSSNGVTLFHDCDSLFSSCALGLKNFFSGLFYSPIHIVKAYDGQNPLQLETMVRVVQGGNQFNATDDKGTTRSIDNLHETTQKVVDEPGFNPGCPDCVHIHWRWDAGLDPNKHSFLVGVGHLNSNFVANSGLPLIQGGSNQDIDIAVVRGDRDPNPPSVASYFTSRGSINPQSGDPQPVVWYLGTGHLNADQFFVHGGFFSDRGTVQGAVITNTSATLNSDGTYTVTFTVTGIANPVNFSLSAAGTTGSLAVIDSGGSFSPATGTALPDTPISVLFTPNSLDSLYGVDVTITDPATGLTGDGEILIVSPFFSPPPI